MVALPTVKATFRPELLVAEIRKSGEPKVFSVSAAKVMVWFSWPTSMVWVALAET